MSKSIRLTYCGIDATGRTVTEAKQAAARDLTALVRDLRNYNPAVVAYCGHAKLVYRGAESWCAMLLTSSHAPGSIAAGGAESGFGNRNDAIRSAAFHVADLAWSHAIVDDMDFATKALAPYLAKADLARDARELAERWAWQRRYKAARDAGYDDNQAHHIAGGLAHLVKPG
jgi:hypothetical protein